MPDFKFDDMLKDAFSANAKAKRGQGADESAKALQFAGLAQVFQHFAETGPGLLQLQQALLNGAAANQAQEAKQMQLQLVGLDDEAARDNLDATNARLMEKIKALEERKAKYAAQEEQMRKTVGFAQNVLKTTRQKDLFHGYVLSNTGKAAADHTVIINQNPAFSAKTNQDGYFVIAFNEKNRTEKFRSDIAASNTFNAGSNIHSTENAVNNTSQNNIVVEVLNEQKESVFTDPFPPSFASDDSVFRVYAVELKK